MRRVRGMAKSLKMIPRGPMGRERRENSPKQMLSSTMTLVHWGLNQVVVTSIADKISIISEFMGSFLQV